MKNDKAIPVNKTYIITEEAAPTGYAKCDDHWELTLDENNIPTVTAIAKQGVATEYESEVVREKNLITYKFYYKNIISINRAAKSFTTQ